MKTNPSFSFKWATILFNYKDYQIKDQKRDVEQRRGNLGK